MVFVSGRSILSIALVGALFATCSKEDVKSKNCVPTSLVWANGDSVAYRYGTAGELIGMDTYEFSVLYKRVRVTNNAANLPQEIWQVVVLPDGSERFEGAFDVFYNNEGRPVSAIQYGFEDKTHGDTLQFSYDASGKLTTYERIGWSPYKYTFEYNDQGNVLRTLYQDIHYPETVAGLYLTFDNHQRFYAGSPGLAIVNMIAYRYVPGHNNPLTATLYYKSGVYAEEGKPVNFTYTYNADGWPTSMEASNTWFVTEIKQLTYLCK